MSEHEHELEPGDEVVLAALRLDGGPGPARRLAEEDTERLLRAALDAGATEARPPTTVPRGSGARWLGIAAAAGIALAATGAVAGIYALVELRRDAARHAGEAAERAAQPVHAPQPEPGAPSADRAATATIAALAEGTGSGAHPVAALAEGTSAAQAVEPEPARGGDGPEPAQKHRPRREGDATAPRTPEDFLDRANALRGRRAWRDAERTYLAVKRAAPRSNASYVALIAAASIRLEHLGDARGALEAYGEARRLAPDGALDADVRFGIAAAHRALGDRAAERRALDALLQAHPGSLFADTARRRLAELSSARPGEAAP